MMMTFSPLQKKIAAAVTCAILVIAVVKCSGDKSNFDPFDHSHDVPVTDMEKHKFEHQFAEQCVARETKNNPTPDTIKIEKDCLCIAQYMLKDLTAPEAEKFLEDEKTTQSLVIKFDAAAYHCLQQNKPKSPDFSRKK